MRNSTKTIQRYEKLNLHVNIGAWEKPFHKPILVWPFSDAPDDIKALSTNGGDEDWVAIVPKELANNHLPWIESSGFDAGRDPQEIILLNGIRVFIGSHA